MSSKISELPAVVAANLLDADVFAAVAGGITSKVAISDLRTKLGLVVPSGRSSLGPAYTTNNAVFNVKDFGAFGDGASHPLSGVYGTLAAAQVLYPHATALTNEFDWAACQLAFNLATVLGGKVYSPPGTYKHDQGLVGKKSVAWCGAGIGATTIIYSGAGQGFTATGTGSENWFSGIYDLTLKTPGTVPAYPATYGIRLTDANDFNIHRVQLTRWGTAGVLLEGIVNLTNVSIACCDIHENQGGVIMQGNNAVANRITIYDNKIRASEGWNIYVPQDVRNWTIFGNDLEAGKTGGVWFLSGLGLSIIANYFEQVTAVPAIVIADTLTYYGVVIVGNNISGTGIANGASAIKLGPTGALYGVLVSGNLISSYQVGVESNGVQSGTLGPNAMPAASVGTRYKITVTQSTTTGLVVHDDYGLRGGSSVGVDKGNAASTVTPGTENPIVVYNTPITANRAVTLAITNTIHGDKFRVIRTAAATGAFTVDVGPGPLKSLAAGQWCDVAFEGSVTQAWKLVGFGTL